MSKIRPHHALLLPVMLVAIMSIATPARADVGEEIIRRCTHAESLSGFSQNAYRQALKDLSAGTEEYSNCAQLIRQAQLAAAGAGRRGGSGGGPATPAPSSAAPTPSEQRAIAHASSAGAAPLQVGAQTIHPGVVHADIASALSSLPTPLLATVAFLTICLLAVAVAGIRNRISAHRGR
ncbi:MAG TPA: hypothetical protein VG053_11715 [Solirubrobacteraceae bacterium]|jgi:hypothetical protein|nr:hypothetical protein [Solirubrobacteraceae bacterium]